MRRKEKQFLGLEKAVRCQGFVRFENYQRKLEFLKTPLAFFGMKLYNQVGNVEFLDADFGNSLTVKSPWFTDKTLKECEDIINEILHGQQYPYKGLTLGRLKGITDFQLSNIRMRENYKITARFNSFAQALAAFRCLTQQNEVRLQCSFLDPVPNYYDGKLATVFETCLRDKFEGLTRVNEVSSKYLQGISL